MLTCPPQHESSLCISIMIGKSIILRPPMWPLPSSSHTHVLAFLQSTTSCDLTSQGRPLKWHGAIVSHPQLLPHHPSLGADFLDRLIILPTDVDRWAFHDTDARLLCSGARCRADRYGGARWMSRGSCSTIGRGWNVNSFLCKPEPITRSGFNQRGACSPSRSSSS
jgi:hypothetical protein